MTRSSLPLTGILVLTLAPTLRSQVSGSVYTTDKQAEVENVFKNKGSVYMAGGPGPNAGCSGNGLANGPYYFQVTDPSGSVLLTPEDISLRAVTVSGGMVTAASGRPTKNGQCPGSKIIQLYPFGTTTSNSGEYKVWLTPAANYMPGVGFHGFQPDFSKTDNFKVKGGKPVEQTIIRGTIFYDIDEDGVYDPSVPGEVPLPGWKVEIDSGGVIEATYVDMDGKYAFLRDMNTTHVISSIAPPAVLGGPPGYVGVPEGRWLPTGVDCWPVTVCTPASSIQVSVVTSVPEIVVDFGKLYMITTPEFARSKGYWHNQGQAELAACEPQWREVINGLCLRENFTNPNPAQQATTIFTVSTGTSFNTAFTELSDYLVGNQAYGILAFILSTHFCAANLNVTCGPMQGVTVYIDRNNNGVLVPLTEMIESTRALLCDPRSANTGPGGNAAWNLVVQGCLMEWEQMGSSGESISTPSPDPGLFFSGY